MNKTLFTVLGVLLASCLAHAEDMRIGTSHAPPYQYHKNGETGGLAVNTVHCALDKLAPGYRTYFYPWKRNISLLKNGKLDMIFSLQPDAKLDNIALLSTPLVMEKWYWYSRANTKQLPGKNANIVVLGGSNEATWLQRNGYKNIETVSNPHSALKMVRMDRADFTLISAGQFSEAVAERRIEAKDFHANFYRFSQLGAYISNRYESEHPGFTQRFNQLIASCNPSKPKLSAQDREELLRVAEQARKLVDTPLIRDAIKQSNRRHQDTNQDRIDTLDQQWRAELTRKSRPLIDKILNRKASDQLKQIKAESNGLYSEIFVTNQLGLNVAQSDVTSDYWQGDEEKFIRTFSAPEQGAPFIGDLEYDASTRSFQSQITFSLSDEGGKLGTATFGINVERALSRH